MSECTHDCSSCGESCADRQGGSPFQIKPLHEGCHVRKVYGVVSGKGGVGKSMVTSQLAVTMQRRGKRVAVLDADITGPSIPNTVRNIVQEAIATFVLVFAICGLSQVPELNDGVGKLLVFGIIVSIGMSLGGLTGYALNPARDLGPRIAHAILPIKGKGSSNFKYGLIVPIFGPIIGGLLAVLLYNVIPWAAV